MREGRETRRGGDMGARERSRGERYGEREEGKRG